MRAQTSIVARLDQRALLIKRLAAVAFAVALFLGRPGTVAAECFQDRLTEGAATFFADVSYRGRWMTFVGTGDFFTDPSNRQIYLLDMKSGDLEQITNFPGSGTLGARTMVDQKARVVAFSSSADRTGGNPDRSPEVFALFPKSGDLVQLTDTKEGITWVVGVDSKAKYVIVYSTADLVGLNKKNLQQFFSIDLASGKIRQLTRLKDRIANFHVGPKGKWVLYEAAGRGPGGSQQVFLLNVRNGKTSRITRTKTGFNKAQSMDSRGRKIAFSSTSAEFGSDGQRPRFVVYDRRLNTFEVLPADEVNRGGLQQAALSESGKVAFLNWESTLLRTNLSTGVSELVFDTIREFGSIWIVDPGRKGKTAIFHSLQNQDLFVLSCS